MQIETAFLDVSLPTRQAKPRDLGFTMMIDWGLPLSHQASVTESAGAYIDMAKIAATIAGLMPKEILIQKLANYKSADISTSQGGLFTEYAYLQGKLEPFFKEVSELGFSAVEISDNLLNWSLAEKRQTIRMAMDDFGLKVLGEVGRKEGVMSDDEVIEDIEVCLDCGVAAVFVEAYELFAGENIRSELISRIAENFPKEKIIYELPVIVLPGISREYKHKVSTWMVAEFGMDVNLANVEWDEIWMTEMLRRRIADNIEMTVNVAD
jgi:phosphosulfolactate synthase